MFRDRIRHPTLVYSQKWTDFGFGLIYNLKFWLDSFWIPVKSKLRITIQMNDAISYVFANDALNTHKIFQKGGNKIQQKTTPALSITSKASLKEY